MTLFDLVLLPFSFTDLRATKQGACLILAAFQPRGHSEHYVVAMITSQLDGLVFPGDTRLTKWSEAGLPKPSLVRLAKVVTIERPLIRKELGSLQAADRKVIREEFRRIFKSFV